jgi:hypothetical protein
MSSWTGGAFGPPWTHAIAALGASLELSLQALRGSRSPGKGAGRRRRGQHDEEGWRRWSELDGCGLLSEERRG